jgi:hypothetical protein
MQTIVIISRDEYPLPREGYDNETEINRCAKELRAIVSKKAGLSYDDYDVIPNIGPIFDQFGNTTLDLEWIKK